MKRKHSKEPSAELLTEAKLNPDGWVYEIDARYDGSDWVPVQGIIRAWRVSPTGDLTGEVWENPEYRTDAN